MKPQLLIRLALALAVLALFALGLSALALDDITNSPQPDHALEWGMVRLRSLLNLAFVVLASPILWRRRSAREAPPSAAGAER